MFQRSWPLQNGCVGASEGLSCLWAKEQDVEGISMNIADGEFDNAHNFECRVMKESLNVYLILLFDNLPTHRHLVEVRQSCY